jgi:hypothetical protein
MTPKNAKGSESEARHQSFWRHLACLADHFFSPLGAPKWLREKIFAKRDEFRL